MSMDNPNEYERAIESYAEAVRQQNEAELKAALATEAAESARDARQAAWRVVKAHVNDRKIKPGIYRLNVGHDAYDSGLLIQEHGDYPELFPMFR